MSSLGDGLALTALPLLAASLTRNAFLVATVVTVQTLPWLVVAIPTGTMVDRIDRGRAMVGANLGSAAVLAAVVVLLFTGGMTIALLYVLAFLLGAFETVYLGAAQAAIPALVASLPAAEATWPAGPAPEPSSTTELQPPQVTEPQPPRTTNGSRRLADDRLSRANGLLTATETAGSQLIGPAAGGVVFVLGRLLPFAADGISFLTSAGLLAGLRGRFPPGQREHRSSFRADTAAGLTFFRRSPLLLTVAALTSGFSFFQAMVIGPLVLYVLYDLHLTRAEYGYFLGLAAIGNVVGALLAPRLRARMGTATILVLAGGLAGAAYLVMGVATTWGLAQAAFAVEALAVASGSVASTTLRQRYVPSELLGRVSNTFRTAVWGAYPLGALAGGALAHGIGLRAPLLVAGGAQLALLVACLLPIHRHIGRVERESEAETPPTGTPALVSPWQQGS